MLQECRRCKTASETVKPPHDFCKNCNRVFEEAVWQLSILFVDFPMDIVEADDKRHAFTPMVHLVGLLDDPYNLEESDRKKLMMDKINENIRHYGSLPKWMEIYNREFEQMKGAADVKVRTYWTNVRQREFIKRHLTEIIKDGTQETADASKS